MQEIMLGSGSYHTWVKSANYTLYNIKANYLATSSGHWINESKKRFHKAFLLELLCLTYTCFHEIVAVNFENKKFTEKEYDRILSFTEEKYYL